MGNISAKFDHIQLQKIKAITAIPEVLHINEVKQKKLPSGGTEVVPHKSIHACLSVGVGGRAGRDRNKQNLIVSTAAHKEGQK